MSFSSREAAQYSVKESDNSASQQQHALLQPDHGSLKGTSRAASWRARVTILVALFLGLALALAHHFFYSYLNGKPVHKIGLSQAWTGRFGIAIAFLVKTAFAVSVTASYVQYQWLRLHKESFRIDEIDSLTSALQNLPAFFTDRVFLRHPLLGAMVVVVWAMPLAAVIAPAALTVGPALQSFIDPQQVPQFEWGFNNFASLAVDGGSTLSSNGAVYKAAFSAASAGRPVTLGSKYQNQTYSLQFHGPAVKCMPASDDMVMRTTELIGGISLGTVFTQFLAWTGGSFPQSLGGNASYAEFSNTLDFNLNPSRIFVATNTGTWNKTVNVTYESEIVPIGVVNVTECLLYNASYNVDYEFQYPNQTQQVSITNWLNPVAASSLQNFDYSASFQAQLLDFASVMQAFGKLLVGSIQSSQYVEYITTVTSSEIVSINWAESEAVQVGLEQLFQNITISLLSNSNFTQNSSTASFVPVHVSEYPITYSYNALDLLLPYGLGLLFAAASACIGLFAFSVNRGSYSNKFSSFLRAAWMSDQLRAMLETSHDGSDPLPREQGKIKVTMSSVGDGLDG